MVVEAGMQMVPFSILLISSGVPCYGYGGSDVKAQQWYLNLSTVQAEDGCNDTWQFAKCHERTSSLDRVARSI